MIVKLNEFESVCVQCNNTQQAEKIVLSRFNSDKLSLRLLNPKSKTNHDNDLLDYVFNVYSEYVNKTGKEPDEQFISWLTRQ